MSSRSLADRAYEELRAAVISRQLEPGSDIVEAEIAAMLGVSRTPVREALRRSELEGYLTRSANGRLVVSSPTADQIEQLFLVRELLESYAVRLAAVRVSPQELEELDRLVAADLQALNADDTDRLAAVNAQLHGAIHAASRNQTLVTLMGTFNGRVHGLQTFAVGSRDDRDRFVHDHQRLVALLRDGDGERAAALVRSHLRHARDVLLEGLPQESSEPPRP